jgi:hypothetical protein
MALGILNYRRRIFVVGTAETRKDPTSRVGHGNSNNVMVIEDFLFIRNFRLAGNGDSFFVAISHALPEFWIQVREERETIQESCYLLATYSNLVCEYGDFENKILEIQRRWHIEKNHFYESDL